MSFIGAIKEKMKLLSMKINFIVELLLENMKKVT